MCTTCGCGTDEHAHSHAPKHTMIRLDRALLGKNTDIAQRNRRRFAERGITALNVVGAPGSGKTALLERTIAAFAGRRPVYVIEGDQATARDAERIRAAGAPVVQINTGPGCHLDAEMIAGALAELDPAPGSLLFIENVGNLVCPALFDLGESAKLLVASVTEGEDKPVKYPHMYRASSLLVQNKIDLLPHLRFDVDRLRFHVREVNAALDIALLSASTGEGMERLVGWLGEVPSGA